MGLFQQLKRADRLGVYVRGREPSSTKQLLDMNPTAFDGVTFAEGYVHQVDPVAVKDDKRAGAVVGVRAFSVDQVPQLYLESNSLQ